MRLIPLVFLLAACGGAPRVAPRPVAAGTRIAFEIQKDALLAPGLPDDLAAELRTQLIAARLGVPVEADADLVIRVRVSSANFTQATEWQWQVVQPTGQATLLAGRDTAAFGITVEDLAGQVMTALATLDTTAYARGGAPPVVAAPPALPAEGAAVAEDPRKWAVVVGVERYREPLAVATGAESDARAFADFARRRLGVPEANTRILLGDRATRADLAGALMEWLPRNAVEPGGTVYVFFSGHGAPDPETGDAYLVPFDANPTYIKSGGLRLSELQGTLGGLKNQQVYLFLDACFSGQGDRSVLAAGTRPLVPIKALAAAAGLVTLAAAGASETTGTHPGGHGLFTHHLLAALNGAADADGNGTTLAEVRDHVVQQVRVEARRQNRDQTPTLAVPTGFDVNTLLVPRR
jgi:hypothetical protein